MAESLLPQRFLFHFSLPCRYRDPIWEDTGDGLDESYRLVDFSELEGRRAFAEVRAAWSGDGLAFSFLVTGKKQPPWCRTSRPEDSDGVQIWIDTRDVHNVHRATRFCHRFLFLPVTEDEQREDMRRDPPSGKGDAAKREGNKTPAAFCQWLPIHRARAHPQAIKAGQVNVRSEIRPDGYGLYAFLAAGALTGFDPQEHPRLGFTYGVMDRELGEQTFTVGSPMPYQEDPSLWGTLELTD